MARRSEKDYLRRMRDILYDHFFLINGSSWGFGLFCEASDLFLVTKLMLISRLFKKKCII